MQHALPSPNRQAPTETQPKPLVSPRTTAAHAALPLPTNLAVLEREGRAVLQQVRRVRLHTLQHNVHAARPAPMHRHSQDGHAGAGAAAGAASGGRCGREMCGIATAAAALLLLLWRWHGHHHMQLRLHSASNGDRPAPEWLRVRCRRRPAGGGRWRQAAEGKRVIGQVGPKGERHRSRAGRQVQQPALLLLLTERGGCGAWQQRGAQGMLDEGDCASRCTPSCKHAGDVAWQNQQELAEPT